HETSLKSSFSFPADIQKIEIYHREQRGFLHTSSSEVLFDLAHKNLHFSLFALAVQPLFLYLYRSNQSFLREYSYAHLYFQELLVLVLGLSLIHRNFHTPIFYKTV